MDEKKVFDKWEDENLDPEYHGCYEPEDVEKAWDFQQEKIDKLEKENVELKNMLIAAKDEMLEVNEDSRASHYLDSANSITEWLKDNQ